VKHFQHAAVGKISNKAAISERNYVRFWRKSSS